MDASRETVISTEEFRRGLDRYVAAARQGGGPVAVTQDSEVVGVFVSASEYEALHGAAVRALLRSRMKGPTVSLDEARARFRAAARRGAKKS